jgi:two-component system sensor histidine kinase BaeS
LRAQIEALQDGVREPDTDTLNAMHLAVMRLSRLVQDIKMLSHSREGRLTTAFDPENLSEIIQEATAAIRPQLEAKGLTLVTDLPDRMPLNCDRLRIGQVIDNLLQNAIRYTAAGGRVRLRGQCEEDTLRITMDDTYPAPPAADLPHLFDRVFRSEASRSRAHGGSGLGLSVSKAIIEAHGGTITATASDLGGLCVTITLPEVMT